MGLQVPELPKQLYSRASIQGITPKSIPSIVNASDDGKVPPMSPISAADPRRRAGRHLSHLCTTIEAFGMREVE